MNIDNINCAEHNQSTIGNKVCNKSKKFFTDSKELGTLIGRVRTPIKLLNVYVQ